MKKITLLFTLAVLTLFGAPRTAMSADQQSLQSFFGSITGLYEGRGNIRQVGPGGFIQYVSYAIRITAEAGNNFDTWHISNQISADTGGGSLSVSSFSIVGDSLWITSAGATEVVQVQEATPFSLTYSFQRVDLVTGRPYQLTFHAELDASGRVLTGHNTVTTVGLTVSDEVFSATRY